MGLGVKKMLAIEWVSGTSWALLIGQELLIPQFKHKQKESSKMVFGDQ